MMTDFLIGYGIIVIYFILCAITAVIFQKLIRIPKEVFRKILHMILLGSIFPWTYGFSDWKVAVIAAFVFIIMVYPILVLGERVKGYSNLLVERKPGEIKQSLVFVFLMFAIVLTVCWGIIGEQHLVIAAVLAWGIGDAAAALVGKRLGRNFIEGKLVEGRKSLEGTLAMFVMSFITVLIVLLLNQSVVWHGYIPISLVTAGVCTVVELYTKGGMDTVTCPLSAAAVLIALVYVWRI